jgi:hypothetical protein
LDDAFLKEIGLKSAPHRKILQGTNLLKLMKNGMFSKKETS